METALESAPSKPVDLPRVGGLPVFLALTALFSLADPGSRGVLAVTALAAAKSAVALFFFPIVGE